jgi:hypothetical protein
MGSRTYATDDLRLLTDVQLVHRMNNALNAREVASATVAPSRPSRLIRAFPLMNPALLSLVLLAVQIRDAIQGGFLAISLAPSVRLVAWAELGERRVEALQCDIAIVRMMREMRRRVGLGDRIVRSSHGQVRAG